MSYAEVRLRRKFCTAQQTVWKGEKKRQEKMTGFYQSLQKWFLTALSDPGRVKEEENA